MQYNERSENKGVGVAFFWLPFFILYCLMTSTLKVDFMLKTPHYPFPITCNFKQVSCLINYPAGNIADLQLSENNHREAYLHKASFINS